MFASFTLHVVSPSILVLIYYCNSESIPLSFPQDRQHCRGTKVQQREVLNHFSVRISSSYFHIDIHPIKGDCIYEMMVFS